MSNFIIDSSNNIIIGNNTNLVTFFNVSINKSNLLDVSINNLDVSGSSRIIGDISMNNVSICNLSVTSNSYFIGDVSMNNVSIGNLSLTGQSFIIGDTSMNNVSIANLSLTGQSYFIGDTSMNNVSIRNLSVTSNSFIIGDTSMNNVSIRNLSLTGNSYFIGDVSMNNVSIRNLSVTSNSYIIGDTSMNNVSIRNLSVTGESFIIGDTSMNNVSIRNLSVTSNSYIIGDTSMNNVSIRNLSVTSNSYIIGDTSMNNVSIRNLSVTGESFIIGDTSMNNVSIRNLSVTSNSFIIGDTSMNNVSIRNLSVTSNSYIIGDTSMNNVSIRNLSVTGESFIIGDTSMNNVSIRNLSVTSNSYIIGDTSMNNVSIRNLSVTGQSFIIGDTSMNNVSISNLLVRLNASFVGDTSMNNVSIRNLSVTGNASFVGDTSMNNVSIRTLFVRQNASFLGDTSMNNLSVNKLTINNLSIENTTFSGTTIFGAFASTPTTIFSTNFNGYFNGIYNTSGVLELGSTTFQRQRLTYNGTTGNMSMIWYASPTDYAREAGRFEVFGRNTGTAAAKTNGDLSIEFTSTTIKNTLKTDSIETSTNPATGITNYFLWSNVSYTNQICFGSNSMTNTINQYVGLNNGPLNIGTGTGRTANINIASGINFGATVFIATTAPTNGATNIVSIGSGSTTIKLNANDISMNGFNTIVLNKLQVTDNLSVTNTGSLSVNKIDSYSNIVDYRLWSNATGTRILFGSDSILNTVTHEIACNNGICYIGNQVGRTADTRIHYNDSGAVVNNVNIGNSRTNFNLCNYAGYNQTINIAFDATSAHTINLGSGTSLLNLRGSAITFQNTPTINTNTININTANDAWSYLNVPGYFQLKSNNNKGIQMYLGPDDNYSSMLFFSKSSTFRQAGRFEMWDNGHGNETNADVRIIFNSTTITNNVNIGTDQAFTNAITSNTVTIGNNNGTTSLYLYGIIKHINIGANIFIGVNTPNTIPPSNCIGYMVTKLSLDTGQTVGTGFTKIGSSFTIDAGTWFVQATCVFSDNSTFCQIGITLDSATGFDWLRTASSNGYNNSFSSGAGLQLSTMIQQTSAQTWKLNATRGSNTTIGINVVRVICTRIA
jgi:hypothetical protein